MAPSSPDKICGLNRNIFFAGIVSFFMDFSSEMVYPLVPLFLWDRVGPPATFLYGTATAWLAAGLFLFLLLKTKRQAGRQLTPERLKMDYKRLQEAKIEFEEKFF